MPNDDLGTFPTPSEPVDPSSATAATSVPDDNQGSSLDPQPQPAPSFEPTPEEIPSLVTPQDELPNDNQDVSLDNPQPSLTETDDSLGAPITNAPSPEEKTAEVFSVPEPSDDTPSPQPEPQPQPEPETAPAEPQPASLPAKSSSIAPLVFVVLLIISTIGIAASVFLFQQSKGLRDQLAEITQTLEKQRTVITPTPSPTVFVAPTPTVAISASPSMTISPTIVPTNSPVSGTAGSPLATANSILNIAIGHSHNAQLILIKTDNASDPALITTKYFFREDLTTKKYFYVAVSGSGSPTIADKQIYVTPDDNIPSLNDSVLGNKMGMDLSEAITLAQSLCSNRNVCLSSPIKAQYIKTAAGIIWQLSIYTKGADTNPQIVQINAETKAILYQSPNL